MISCVNFANSSLLPSRFLDGLAALVRSPQMETGSGFGVVDALVLHDSASCGGVGVLSVKGRPPLNAERWCTYSKI